MPPDAATRTATTKTKPTSSTSRSRSTSSSRTAITTRTASTTTTRAIATLTSVPNGGTAENATSSTFLAGPGTVTTVELTLPASCTVQCYIFVSAGALTGSPTASLSFASTGLLARRQISSDPVVQVTLGGGVTTLLNIDNYDGVLQKACNASAITQGRCKIVVSVGDPAAFSAGSVNLIASLVPPTSVSAPSSVRLSYAMATGDSSRVTGNELRAAIAAVATDKSGSNTALMTQLWSTPDVITSSASWYMFPDTISFRIMDTDNVMPFITSNFDARPWVAGAPQVLAVGGKTLGGRGGRFLAFGGNFFKDTDNGDVSSVNSINLFKNMLAWVVGRNPATSPNIRFAMAEIPTAHCPFVYENQMGATQYQFSTTYWPGAVTAGSLSLCYGSKLAQCLATAEVLILGHARIEDEPGTIQDVFNAVTLFTAAGKPIIYLHVGQGESELSRLLFPMFGIAKAGGNWAKNPVMKAATSVTQQALVNRHFTAIGSMISTLTGSPSLNSSDVASMLSGSGTYWPETADVGFVTKLGDGASAMHSFFSTLDASGQALFALGGFSQYKMIALLGDKYRLAPGSDAGTTGFSYPIATTNLPAPCLQMQQCSTPGLLPLHRPTWGPCSAPKTLSTTATALLWATTTGDTLVA